jgi:hypothetical protein
MLDMALDGGRIHFILQDFSSGLLLLLVLTVTVLLAVAAGIDIALADLQAGNYLA